jgi:Uma2 family endonuclease
VEGSTVAPGTLSAVPTLVLDPQPAELTALIERRRSLGQDLFDAVWEGVLHMNPAPSGAHARLQAQLLAILRPLAADAGLTIMGQFNLGDDERDYRVPDGGLHADWSDQVFYPTAALVVEILSPGDESRQKLPFYAAHGVDEVLIVDPQEHRVEWLGLAGAICEPLERSRLLVFGPAELEQQLDWP